jgi:hypothetical protein
MDEKTLESQRRPPRPEFARDLRDRLARIEDDEAARPAWPAGPMVAAAAALAVVAGLILFPSLRVSAQALLDLFRIREFAIVQVDESRLKDLRERKLDPASLLGGKPETLQSPGPARAFGSVEGAAAATGLRPESPAVLPRGLALDSVFVEGESRSRATVDTKPLADLMAVYGIHEVALPPGLDGSTIEVHVPPVVVERYRSPGRWRAALVQCAGPEVSLPPGVDLARLGEIGLRVLGVAPADAHRLATRIDWRSTLVVPVVASATTFQQVDVRGARGVYLETNGSGDAPHGDKGPGAALLWSRDGRVYAVMGNLDRLSLVQMAESVR